ALAERLVEQVEELGVVLDDRQVRRLLEAVAALPADDVDRVGRVDPRRRRQAELAVPQPRERRHEEDQPHRHPLERLLEEADCGDARDDPRAVERVRRRGHAVREEGLHVLGHAEVAVVLVEVPLDEPRRDVAPAGVDHARAGPLRVRDDDVRGGLPHGDVDELPALHRRAIIGRAASRPQRCQPAGATRTLPSSEPAVSGARPSSTTASSGTVRSTTTSWRPPPARTATASGRSTLQTCASVATRSISARLIFATSRSCGVVGRPSMTTRPPRRVHAAAAAVAPSRPVASTTTAAPSPPVASRTAATTSCERASTTTSAPRRRAVSSRRSRTSAAISGAAPRAFA